MSSAFIYWVIKLDSIIGLLNLIMIPIAIVFYVAVAAAVVTWILQLTIRDVDEYSGKREASDEDIEKRDRTMGIARKYISKALLWSMPFYFILIITIKLIPTTKEMAVIYVLPQILNNKNVQQIPEKFIKLANEWLDELSPEKVLEKK